MSGNCATGMRSIEIAPASVMTMAITTASRGRRMKAAEITDARRVSSRRAAGDHQPTALAVTAPLQLDHGARRHREDDEHRVLADDRHQGAGRRADIVAGRDRGAADLAVDRRADLGVVEVDAGLLELRLG